MESFLQNNDIEMLSTCNERKSVVAERFIRTLKDKIYKHMTSTSRNVSNDKLDDIIDKYNNTYHSKIKTCWCNIKHTYWLYWINNKDPKFKIGHTVRISKYKNIFAKGYTTNWSEENFQIKRVKNTVPWTYVIKDLKMERKLLERFTKTSCQKQIKKKLELKK